MTTPTFDPASAPDYRRVLGCVPTSVAVIAGMEGDSPVGVSVGSFSSVSLAPPLVGFFIASTSSSWPRIAPTGGFCASILSAAQEPVSRAFATPGADKFASCTWSQSPAGRPIIDGSVMWVDCTIHEVVPAGDHALVLGRVDAMGAVEADDPLLFVGGGYGRPVPVGGAAGSWA